MKIPSSSLKARAFRSRNRYRLATLSALTLVVGCQAAPDELEELEELELQDEAEESDGDRPPMDDDGALAAPTDDPVSQSVGSNPHHRVEVDLCPAGDDDCAESIPMTGRSSPLFAELDDAMRQYMKIHCVGASVLAVSRKGRRVYKRGFGRTKGVAAVFDGICPEADYDATGKYMLPDTPLAVASVSKYVTAPMVRELVAERIAQRPWCTAPANVGATLLTDPCLELLPSDLLRHMDPSRGDFVPPPVDSDPAPCATATACAGPVCPDQGWTSVTVGDLIAHTSGLDRDVDGIDFLMANVGAIRGYVTESDWTAAHAHLANKTKYPAELAAVRTELASVIGGGVSASDILFLDYYDDANGRDEQDDGLIAATGRCFLSPPGGTTDALWKPNPGSASAYSNLGYQFLGRIISHLHGELGLGLPRYDAPFGFPELHDQTALGTFLADNGIEEGIWADRAIFRRELGYAPGYLDPIPERRKWDSDFSTYVPPATFRGRPFCVWDEMASNPCDTSNWSNFGSRRATWDFTIDDPQTAGISEQWVPFYRQWYGIWQGSGDLAAEAPALLTLLDRYSTSGGQRFGMEHATCGAACDDTGGQGGNARGSIALVKQLEGGTLSATVPVDGGEYVTEQDMSQWTTIDLTNPSDVRYAVAINTSTRESYTSEPDPVTGIAKTITDWKSSFESIDPWLGYAMGTPTTPAGAPPNIDWDAVDRMIAHQSRHIVGMGMASSASWYFYEDDTFGTDYGTPGSHLGPSVPAGIYDYSLPATRIGTDVVGVAIFGTNTYAWYDDGHYSATTGWPTDLGTTIGSADYVLPAGKLYDELVGIAFASDGSVYSWYRDGTRARGFPNNLGATFVGGYSRPPGQTYDDIEAIAIDWENDNRTWTRFRDGSVSKGYTYDLDGIDYDRGPVVGMSMFEDQTRVWYANGYWRLFNGTPHDNMNTPVVLERGYWDVSDGYDHADVLGIAESADGEGWIYYDDGQHAQITSGLVVDTTNAFTPPPGHTVADLAAVALDDNGDVVSWYHTGQYAVGTHSNLGNATQPFAMPIGPSISSIAGIAYDTNGGGYVWTLFDFGGVSQGNEGSLAASGFWNAP